MQFCEQPFLYFDCRGPLSRIPPTAKPHQQRRRPFINPGLPVLSTPALRVGIYYSANSRRPPARAPPGIALPRFKISNNRWRTLPFLVYSQIVAIAANLGAGTIFVSAGRIASAHVAGYSARIAASILACNHAVPRSSLPNRPQCFSICAASMPKRWTQPECVRCQNMCRPRSPPRSTFHRLIASIHRILVNSSAPLSNTPCHLFHLTRALVTPSVACRPSASLQLMQISPMLRDTSFQFRFSSARRGIPQFCYPSRLCRASSVATERICSAARLGTARGDARRRIRSRKWLWQSADRQSRL